MGDQINSKFEKSVQKLKYIFLSTNPDARLYKFEEWQVDDFHEDGYSIQIIFDYEGAVDADMEEFFDKIRFACSQITNIIEEYPIDQNGNLNKETYISVTTGIFELTFSYDEKCLINIDVRAHYGE